MTIMRIIKYQFNFLQQLKKLKIILFSREKMRMIFLSAFLILIVLSTIFADDNYITYTETFPWIGPEGEDPEIVFEDLIKTNQLYTVKGQNEMFYSDGITWINEIGKIRNDCEYTIKIFRNVPNHYQENNIQSQLNRDPTTIIVDINGSGDYTSIQEGINNSVNGDTVLVYPGTYYENINYNGINITVASLYFTTLADSFIHQTIIDGNQNGSVVTFESGEDTTAILCGFTIQNGSGTYNDFLIMGGGILIVNSQASINNCIITNNISQGGAGICLYNSTVNIAGSNIINNHCTFWGGGIGLYNSEINFNQINRCNIYLNYAGIGSDLMAINCGEIDVIIDTFTVELPDDDFASPIDIFVFDINNNKIEQTDNDLFVSPYGDNNNSGLNINEPLKTISYALVKIKSNKNKRNSIYLSPGSYSPITNNEKLPLNCKSYITIHGSNKASTKLDGSEQSFIFFSRYDSSYTIENLTVENGFSYDYNGGGMLSDYSIDIIIKSVNFIYNKATDGGGAIFMNNSTIIFENCLIKDNCAEFGGGLEITQNSNSVFINCIIDSNYTITPDWGFGGAISNNVESNSIFINTQITHNISDNCSGITVSGGAGNYCDPTFINCTICDNSENPGGTIRQGDHSHVSLINTILRNPSQEEIIFWEGYPLKTVSLSYCNIDGGIDAINTNNSGTIIWGEGNIDEDPKFVGGNPFSYELTKYSPCIDAGTPDTTGLHLPATDLAGNPRIFNGRIDIGAYECQDTISIDEPDTSFIHNLYLFQNTPNPFTNETEILFITADYERVEDYSLSIYNTKGQLVRRFDGTTHDFWVKTKIMWDGTDEHGRQVAPGTYLYKLEYNGNAVVRKMTLLR